MDDILVEIDFIYLELGDQHMYQSGYSCFSLG